MADDVAPRLDLSPAFAPKPPSGFWNAATKAAVRIRSAGDSRNGRREHDRAWRPGSARTASFECLRGASPIEGPSHQNRIGFSLPSPDHG